MTATSRNETSRGQNAGPNPRSNPGGRGRGRSTPASHGDALQVVEPVEGRDDGSRNHTDHGSPQSQLPRGLERESADDEHGHEKAERGTRRRALAGAGGQEPGDERHDRDRDEHDHGPRNSGREDALEERQAHESTRGTSAAMATRVASSAGPPVSSARMDAGMKAPDVPMTRTCPMPNRPVRVAWNTVARPQIVTEARTPTTGRRRSCRPPA